MYRGECAKPFLLHSFEQLRFCFVEGSINGNIFDSDIGQFVTAGNTVANGKAVLSIRPESIEMGANGDQTNIAKTRVISHVYMGTHARYKVGVGDHELEIVTDPQAIRSYSDGDEVNVRFPPEYIWVLPSEEKLVDKEPEEELL